MIQLLWIAKAKTQGQYNNLFVHVRCKSVSMFFFFVFFTKESTLQSSLDWFELQYAK